MFELSQFYDYCKQNEVAVIPYSGLPHPGATLRDDTRYGVFLDFTQIPTTKVLRGVCSHELSHLATGALHRVASPYDLAQRSEYRANRYFSQHFLTQAELRRAFRQGYTQLWQLSEYFDLPEEDIQKALAYWTISRNTNWNEPN